MVIVPLVLGVLIYQFADGDTLIRNYLPDGLWAFSFGYAFLLIWNPAWHSAIHIVPILVFIGFELLQKWRIITGTFDLFDCVAYILFYLSASIVFYQYEQKTTS